MRRIQSLEDLRAIYPAAISEAAQMKVVPHLTPGYRRWIEASRFVVLSTVGPEGTDASPRGDDAPVVRVVAPDRLMLPDWKGNNRIDSLLNILRDPRVSLMFMVVGSTNVMRVNGRAFLTDDPGTLAGFARGDATPRSVIVVETEEVYVQCARAVLRAGLWTSRDDAQGLPTVGQMMAEIRDGFDGQTYDTEWQGRAAGTMW